MLSISLVSCAVYGEVTVVANCMEKVIGSISIVQSLPTLGMGIFITKERVFRSSNDDLVRFVKISSSLSRKDIFRTTQVVSSTTFVGNVVGGRVGSWLGVVVGWNDGDTEGRKVGCVVGDVEGEAVGSAVGDLEGKDSIERSTVDTMRNGFGSLSTDIYSAGGALSEMSGT